MLFVTGPGFQQLENLRALSYRLLDEVPIHQAEVETSPRSVAKERVRTGIDSIAALRFCLFTSGTRETLQQSIEQVSSEIDRISSVIPIYGRTEKNLSDLYHKCVSIIEDINGDIDSSKNTENINDDNLSNIISKFTSDFRLYWSDNGLSAEVGKALNSAHDISEILSSSAHSIDENTFNNNVADFQYHLSGGIIERGLPPISLTGVAGAARLGNDKVMPLNEANRMFFSATNEAVRRILSRTIVPTPVPNQQIAPYQYDLVENQIVLVEQGVTPKLGSLAGAEAAFEIIQMQALDLISQYPSTNSRLFDLSLKRVVDELSGERSPIRLGLLAINLAARATAASDELSNTLVSAVSVLTAQIGLYVAQFEEWQSFLDAAAESNVTVADATAFVKVARELSAGLSDTNNVAVEVGESLDKIAELESQLTNPKVRLGIVRTIQNLIAAAFRDLSANVWSFGKTAAGYIIAATVLKYSVQLSSTFDSEWLEFIVRFLQHYINK